MKKKSTFILIILLIPIRFVFAANTPTEIVRKFCELDFVGARLSSDRYETIKPLVAYPVEPGWDIAIGIKSYKIESENIQGNKAKVVVKYDIDQSWPPGVEVKNLEVIELLNSGGIWRIEKYVKYPRVSAEVLCTQFHKCK